MTPPSINHYLCINNYRITPDQSKMKGCFSAVNLQFFTDDAVRK